MDLIEKELSYKIRGAVFEVSRELGAGFLEKVYERALMIELERLGLNCKKQFPIPVTYKGDNIGNFVADIVVENRVILELKAQQDIRSEHTAHLINYLKATHMKIGLLINFNVKILKNGLKRFVL